MKENFLNSIYLSNDIKELREWQKEVINQEEWITQQNYIINVPTSQGKTLIAEIAIHDILDNLKAGIVIYCVPFVALAEEKFNFFRKNYSNYFTTFGYYHYKSTVSINPGVIVCTYEVVNKIVNILQKKNQSFKIQLIIVDEIQTIGDESRGHIVESFLTLFKLFPKPPRVIGLSASLSQNSAEKLSKWLHAKLYFNNNFKSNIEHYLLTKESEIKNNNFEQLNPPINFHKVDGNSRIIELVKYSYEQDKNGVILIFVNSKDDCEILASQLENSPFFDTDNKELEEKRIKLWKKMTKKFSQEYMDKKSRFISGIGVHNGGLLLDERNLIEDAIKNQIFQIIICTTTLSYGINFPNISTIIIKNIINYENKFLSVADYIQKSGRTGRILNKIGKCYILQNNNEKELPHIKKLFSLKPDDIEGNIFNSTKTNLFIPEHFIDKYLLQLKHYYQFKEINYLEQTFTSFLNPKINLSDYLNEREEILKKINFLKNDKKLTENGEIITESNLSINDGFNLINSILKNIITDYFDYFYLIIPNDIEFHTYKNFDIIDQKNF